MNAVLLRWPSPVLSPNARAHYMTKHRATRSYRQTTCIMGRGQKRLQNPACAILPLVATRRRRDLDNVLASLKSALDGLTDAGWWDDDHKIAGYHLVPEIHCKELAENRIVILAVEVEEMPAMTEAVTMFRSACLAGNAANAARDLLGVML